MIHRFAILAAACAASGLSAQEFRGAEVAVEALSFDADDDGLTSTGYRGSAEMAVMGAFGVAADLSFYDFEDGDGARNVTLHVLYDALEFATVGAFVSRDAIDDLDADTIGVEAGRSFGSLGGEAYFGLGDDGAADYRIMGVDGAFDVAAALSLTGRADLVQAEGGDLSRVAVGAEYRLGGGPTLYAEAGRLRADDGAFAASADFVGIGARIGIGPQGGTTFEPRGVGEVIAGF